MSTTPSSSLIVLRDHKEPGGASDSSSAAELSALPRTDVLAGALAKLRAATELARGYAPAVVTRAEAHALLDHFASLERHTRSLEDARDKWYVREGKLKQARSRYRQQADRYREENERLRRGEA